ncbi:MAG: hypothetical protein IT210_14665 [Armatimonadetes bacterium]|nr:hypothetical protein [Armatimonadota bacterium]
MLEWPFCFFMVGRGEGALRKALCISLAAQVASYAILVPYYYVFSNDTLYRNMDIRKDLSFVRRPAPVVYYIGLRDGDIWLIRADGTGRRKVREANITDPYARLTVRPRPGNPKGDIWLIVKDGSARSRNPLLTEAASRFALHPDYLERGSERDSAFNFSSGPDFRPEGRREWTMFGDFWGGSGTDVRRNRHGVYKFGFDLPFMFYAARWNTGNFNYLPGD